MYIINEQQASELLQRCKTIHTDVDPQLFAQIEAIILQAVSSKQLSDDEISLMYELLSRATSNLTQKTESAMMTQNECDDSLIKQKDNMDTQQEKDQRNHKLLCNKTNLRSVANLRWCIKCIHFHGEQKPHTQTRI